MGRYIMRTGSTGLGSILFTSPRITGHRHLSVRSPSTAAAVLFRNMPSPPQHSLCGVGVSASAPVRNDAHVVSPASDVTQSVGDDTDDEPAPPAPLLPGMPGMKVPGIVCADLPHGGGSEPAAAGGDNGRPGTDDAGDGFGAAARGDGLAPGNPGKRWRLPGKAGKRRARASDEAKAVFLGRLASDGCSIVAITEATMTSTTTTPRFDTIIVDEQLASRVLI
ncbi:hypothetical protein E2562_004357 [Oryza meyeriana var. granulata]|uniref:Uncharacterized protein n=1 Tax=Oryza meyeriana var. granulata TaxID=110450 RepID=A0A6G1CYW5_9ORYZ|nr:hypothetical protein E2562_004357 [Oryza meyeriana var. granulata]